jgi:hypothetical protein
MPEPFTRCCTTTRRGLNTKGFVRSSGGFHLLAILLLSLIVSRVAQAQQIPITADGDPTAAASNCIDGGYGDDMNRFSACWVMQMASPQTAGGCELHNDAR